MKRSPFRCQRKVRELHRKIDSHELTISKLQEELRQHGQFSKRAAQVSAWLKSSQAALACSRSLLADEMAKPLDEVRPLA